MRLKISRLKELYFSQTIQRLYPNRYLYHDLTVRSYLPSLKVMLVSPLNCEYVIRIKSTKLNEREAENRGGCKNRENQSNSYTYC